VTLAEISAWPLERERLLKHEPGVLRMIVIYEVTVFSTWICDSRWKHRSAYWRPRISPKAREPRECRLGNRQHAGQRRMVVIVLLKRRADTPRQFRRDIGVGLRSEMPSCRKVASIARSGINAGWPA